MHENAHQHDVGRGVSEHGDVEHHHVEHHGGLGKYIAVFVALCILTAISFATAQFMMGPDASNATLLAGRVVMIAVSCCKALLVMLFFMHLIWEANWKYVLTIPASIMSIFLLLMLFPDVLDRTRTYSEERWLYAAEPRAETSHDTEDTHGDDATKTPTKH
jgi:cytochrome c oxidase subunit IV